MQIVTVHDFLVSLINIYLQYASLFCCVCSAHAPHLLLFCLFVCALLRCRALNSLCHCTLQITHIFHLVIPDNPQELDHHRVERVHLLMNASRKQHLNG